MSEVDYARIFDVLPSPFMLVDRDLRFVAANKAYLDTVGWPLEELLGKGLLDLFPNPGESGKKLHASLERVFHTGEPDTLPFLPYPITTSDGAESNRYWTAVHVPVMGADGRPDYVLQNTVDVTDFAWLREAATLPYSSLSAATRLIERTRETEAASADFRRLFQQAPAFFAVLSGPDHVFTFSSDSYQRLVGGRNVIGKPTRLALPEVVEQGFIDILDRVYREGYTHHAEGARIMLANQVGGPPEETFLDFSYAPIRDADDRITGVFVQGMDRTESVRAGRRQKLLIDELNHRVKNTLATVQSIASQSLRNATDLAAARKNFENRIMALSKAHSMLSDRSWHDTEIGHLIGLELRAFDSDHVQFGGPDLVINAKATVALALVMHELATNAARHGSLSMPEGRLDVSWSEGAGDNLVIEWTERGGPGAVEPSRSGFGSRLLRTVVTGELGGTLDTRFAQEGFSARLEIPPSAYCAREQALV
jgi:PAS domain S-box-containing protein